MRGLRIGDSTPFVQLRVIPAQVFQEIFFLQGFKKIFRRLLQEKATQKVIDILPGFHELLEFIGFHIIEGCSIPSAKLVS